MYLGGDRYALLVTVTFRRKNALRYQKFSNERGLVQIWKKRLRSVIIIVTIKQDL
jgi:hypothetical protein